MWEGDIRNSLKYARRFCRSLSTSPPSRPGFSTLSANSVCSCNAGKEKENQKRNWSLGNDIRYLARIFGIVPDFAPAAKFFRADWIYSGGHFRIHLTHLEHLNTWTYNIEHPSTHI